MDPSGACLACACRVLPPIKGYGASRVNPTVFPRAPSEEPPVVRLSPSYYNTEDEIDAAAAALREILEEKA